MIKSDDPKLEDDRIVYRSILISRRVDPIFVKNSDQFDLNCRFGEIGGFERLSEPEDAAQRFLAANYRGNLWRLDDKGSVFPLHVAPDVGGVACFAVLRDQVVCAFTNRGLQRIERQRLADLDAKHESFRFEDVLPPQGQAQDVQALCPLAWARQSNDFLWLDRQGRVHFCTGIGHGEVACRTVHELSPSRDESSQGILLEPRMGIEATVFETFVASFGQEQMRLVAVANSTGELLLLSWQEDEDGGQIQLRPEQRLRVGLYELTAFLAAGPFHRQLFVASQDGTVTCLRLLRGEQRGLRLVRMWSFQAGDVVRTIRALDWQLDASHVGSESSMVIFGSYDQHLYVFDLQGRHLETFLVRNFKVGPFLTRQAPGTESNEAIVVQVYVCGFENQYFGLRLLDRGEWIRRLHVDLRKEPGQLEQRLTRWRTFSMDEGHLRHNFIRQSSRYPGPGTQAVLRELERLIRVNRTDRFATGEVTALLRRLFQNRLPIELDSDAQGELSGVQAMLEDHELYVKAIAVLRQLEVRWGTPNSLENRRVLIFWIRSLLRNINTRELYQRWLQIDRSEDEPLIAPPVLIDWFLRSSNALVQFKALQYLERMLFGWPGVANSGVLKGPQGVDDHELKWLIELLAERLRVSALALDQTIAEPALSQGLRLLVLMLLHERIEPLNLVVELRARRVPRQFFCALADQLEGLVDYRRQQAAHSYQVNVLRTSYRLIHLLESDPDGSKVAEQLGELITECNEGLGREGCPNSDFLRRSLDFLQPVLGLWQAGDLESLQKLRGVWEPPPDGEPHATQARRALGRVPAFLDHLYHYWQQKFRDLYGEYDDGEVLPLTSLQVQDFARVRQSERTIRQHLEVPLSGAAPLGVALTDKLLNRWTRWLDEEQQRGLLEDFLTAVNEYCEKELPQAPLAGEAAQRQLEQEQEQARLALINLFTRLVLSWEPREAFFILWSGDRVEIRRFVPPQDDGEGRIENLEAGSGQTPGWFDEGWRDPERFSQLDDAALRNTLQQSSPGRRWHIEEISAGLDQYRSEQFSAFGFYISGWDEEDQIQTRYIEDSKVFWAVPLQALLFRRASIQQEMLKGRLYSMAAHSLGSPLFHMRTHLGLLKEGFLERDAEKRAAKYDQLLREARHMSGVVDAILNLGGREIELQLAEVSLAQLLYELVRTLRTQARARGITLNFPRPSEDVIRASRIKTDETKVYDTLLNIIENAIKYSPRDGEVGIVFQVDSHGANVWVEDQGEGISPAHYSKLFDAYWRSPQAQAKAQGMGLGLYIAKLYVDALRGRIQVTGNESGSGTTFNLFLPNPE